MTKRNKAVWIALVDVFAALAAFTMFLAIGAGVAPGSNSPLSQTEIQESEEGAVAEANTLTLKDKFLRFRHGESTIKNFAKKEAEFHSYCDQATDFLTTDTDPGSKLKIIGTGSCIHCPYGKVSELVRNQSTKNISLARADYIFNECKKRYADINPTNRDQWELWKSASRIELVDNGALDHAAYGKNGSATNGFISRNSCKLFIDPSDEKFYCDKRDEFEKLLYSSASKDIEGLTDKDMKNIVGNNYVDLKKFIDIEIEYRTFRTVRFEKVTKSGIDGWTVN